MAHKPFPRPWNKFNQLVDCLLGSAPVRHEITEEDVERWLAQSIDTFRSFVADELALEDARSGTDWQLSDCVDFDSAWSLEVTFNGDITPQVNVFLNAVWTRLLLPRILFEAVAQTGVDHAVGHLYAFHKGEKEYGEKVACYLQFLAALNHPQTRYRLIAAMIPMLHWFHKNIPLRNYSSERHPGL